MNTTRQEQALKFIKGYIQSNGEAPRMVEIRQRLGYRSNASVHEVLTALENRGLIRRTPNISRGIEVVNET